MSKKEKEIEACFLLYDYPKRNKISNNKLVQLMNCLGQNPTESELKQMIKIADPYDEGSFTMEGFKKVMQNFNNIQYTRTDLRSAYDLLDRDQDGNISREDLKNASNLLLGQPLAKEKIDFMFNNLKIEGDSIDFEQFMRLLS